MSLIQMFFYKQQYAKALNYLAAIRTIPDEVRGDSRYHKQTGLYLLAQSSYFLKQYEQAEILAKECLAINPNNAWAYSTLAEIYSLMGKDEGFYEALEEALKRGISVSSFIEDMPYQRFLNKKRFEDLIAKYEQKKASLDQVAKN